MLVSETWKLIQAMGCNEAVAEAIPILCEAPHH